MYEVSKYPNEDANAHTSQEAFEESLLIALLRRDIIDCPILQVFCFAICKIRQESLVV